MSPRVGECRNGNPLVTFEPGCDATENVGFFWHLADDRKFVRLNLLRELSESPRYGFQD
jgi:hypothetical protein